jgi:Spy/CpxP family protein refolding chaperone
MKRKFFKTTVIALAVLFTGTLAYSQPPRGKGMPSPGTHFAMKQNMLNLTDEQKDQMKQMFLDRMKETLPLRNEMAVLKAEYRQLIAAEKPDQKNINANIDKQTDLINKMKKVHAKYTLKMRDVLTEEQWLIMQSHKGMRGKGGPQAGFHGKGMGAGPCGMGNNKGPSMRKPGMKSRPGMMMKMGDKDN